MTIRKEGMRQDENNEGELFTNLVSNYISKRHQGMEDEKLTMALARQMHFLCLSIPLF